VNARGFSLVELLVTMAITIAITGGMFSFIHSARGVFEVDLEHTDTQQRARVAADALFRDLVMAGAGLQSPPLAPFRRGSINPDSPGSAFPDRISVLYVPPDAAAGAITVTYGRRVDAAGVPHLTRYDGAASEMPLVDQVTGLRFEYLDVDGQLIAMNRFADGPWVPDAVAADRFDADLQAIRRVRAFVRLRPARVFAAAPLADLEVVIDVSPRNLNLQ
jgi:prepilin-type N-terminal cleavage/methylation domain-containing protein